MILAYCLLVDNWNKISKCHLAQKKETLKMHIPYLVENNFNICVYIVLQENVGSSCLYPTYFYISASFSVISAKAVSSLIQLTFAGDNQLQYYTFYIMTIVMFSTAILQVK